jgi:GTP-sensing pleiotropic transcriptional regulator CodY
MTILERYLDFLNESYTTTLTKRGRQQKIKTTAGSIGISLARKKNDPLYKKMIYQKHMYMKTKQQLQKKYKSKANLLARQKANTFKK